MASLNDMLAAVYELTPNNDRGLCEPLQAFIKECEKTVLGRKGLQSYARKNHSFAIGLLDTYYDTVKESTPFEYWCLECKEYEVPGVHQCCSLEDYEDADFT